MHRVKRFSKRRFNDEWLKRRHATSKLLSGLRSTNSIEINKESLSANTATNVTYILENELHNK